MQFAPAQTDDGQPFELELADGSRLIATKKANCRVTCSGDERITLADALSLEGQPFAGFELQR